MFQIDQGAEFEYRKYDDAFRVVVNSVSVFSDTEGNLDTYVNYTIYIPPICGLDGYTSTLVKSVPEFARNLASIDAIQTVTPELKEVE